MIAAQRALSSYDKGTELNCKAKQSQTLLRRTIIVPADVIEKEKDMDRLRNFMYRNTMKFNRNIYEMGI